MWSCSLTTNVETTLSTMCESSMPMPLMIHITVISLFLILKLSYLYVEGFQSPNAYAPILSVISDSHSNSQHGPELILLL